MDIFVIQRDLPITQLARARREFDLLRAAAAESADLELVCGLYLARAARSLAIVMARDEQQLTELLGATGLRHSSVHAATPFPGPRLIARPDFPFEGPF